MVVTLLSTQSVSTSSGSLTATTSHIALSGTGTRVATSSGLAIGAKALAVSLGLHALLAVGAGFVIWHLAHSPGAPSAATKNAPLQMPSEAPAPIADEEQETRRAVAAAQDGPADPEEPTRSEKTSRDQPSGESSPAMLAELPLDKALLRRWGERRYKFVSNRRGRRLEGELVSRTKVGEDAVVLEDELFINLGECRRLINNI